jgi:hypothetical protein
MCMACTINAGWYWKRLMILIVPVFNKNWHFFKFECINNFHNLIISDVYFYEVNCYAQAVQYGIVPHVNMEMYIKICFLFVVTVKRHLFQPYSVFLQFPANWRIKTDNSWSNSQTVHIISVLLLSFIHALVYQVHLTLNIWPLQCCFHSQDVRATFPTNFNFVDLNTVVLQLR